MNILKHIYNLQISVTGLAIMKPSLFQQGLDYDKERKQPDGLFLMTEWTPSQMKS